MDRGSPHRLHNGLGIVGSCSGDRPEIVIDDGGQGDVRFGEPCSAADEARRRALQACEAGNSGTTA
jgi:hypothetical protein